MEGDITGKKLLVVDDEVAFSEFVSEIASQAGFHVTAIEDSSLFEQIYLESSISVCPGRMVLNFCASWLNKALAPNSS
jgi:DNA-binding response OmpR family regulator